MLSLRQQLCVAAFCAAASATLREKKRERAADIASLEREKERASASLYCMLTYADVEKKSEHTSAYVSIRQHTSAYERQLMSSLLLLLPLETATETKERGGVV
jgi:hypothetical protein